MKLNQKQFTHTLKKMKSYESNETVSFSGELSEYLLEHYLMPFIEGRTLHVGDLDYSTFTVEDVRDFEQYLACASENNCKLLCLCKKFITAKPLALVRRAFC